MRHDVFAVRREQAHDRCEHCDRLVGRVWLVPGDVLNSCAACFQRATGRSPVDAQGHTTVPEVLVRRAPARWHQRIDGRRPA